MPSMDQHWRQAQRNRMVAGVLMANGCYDWAAVVLFYLAVHLTEAMLAQKDIHLSNHGDREFYISREAMFADDYMENYQTLKQASIDVRYLCRGKNSRDVNERLQPALDALSAHVSRQLGRAF